jgi:Tol biopolymer transport system component
LDFSVSGGEKIGCIVKNAVEIMDVNGKKLNRWQPVEPIEIQQFVWSPDGNAIALVAQAKLDRQPPFSNLKSNAIFTLNFNDTKLTKIAQGGYQPKWSNDGRQIAFVINPAGGSSIRR